MPSPGSQLFIFGGDKPWSSLDWTASDDRVRGGSSISHLKCTPSSAIAVFTGNLDIKTLGGAGFASQRTTGEAMSWDLSKYDGIELNIEKSDGKTYTLILKDELLPKRLDNREQSSVSYEYDFRSERAQCGDCKVFIAWDDFKPTYRGRKKKDAEPLDLKNIKRLSLMMRSFFGTQEGNFSLSIKSIAASTTGIEPYRDDPNGMAVPMNEKSNNIGGANVNVARDWLGWLLGFCLS